MKPAREIPALGDVDLHLHLAGALPPGKRLLLRWRLLLDPDLRERLAELRRGNADFAAREMASLRGRLFPEAPAPSVPVPGSRPASARPRAAAGDRSGFPGLPGFFAGRRPGYALAGAFAVLALCALPFLGRFPAPAPAGGADAVDGIAAEGSDVIAKGRGLGVTLYVKGDSAYRVEDHAARLFPSDTLQAVPLGSAPQHLVLFGWDGTQGLVRLFPAEGASSRRVTASEPPPALLLQGMEENRLVCVTSTSPFRVEDALALLDREPFRPLPKAPAARLEKGLFVQVFAITKTRRGGI